MRDVGTVLGVGRVTSRTPVLRIRGPQHTTRPDTVAAEEPLEIRLDGTPLAVTMRTPGDDFDLVHGFLATEGVIRSAADVAGLRYCNSVDAEGRNTYNVVDVDLAPGVEAPDTALDRNFYTSSSCGVCGKASIDAIRTRTAFDVSADGPQLAGRGTRRGGRHHPHRLPPRRRLQRLQPHRAAVVGVARRSGGRANV